MPATKKSTKSAKQDKAYSESYTHSGSTAETFKVKGNELLKKIQELIDEGNVRQITIKDKNGKTLVVIPMTIGVVGAVFAPVLAGVGAIAALVTECTITVERRD